MNDEGQEQEQDLVPELGDWVTFLSDAYKTTSGRIIYRDGSLIRIRPTHSSHTAVDFPLNPETGLFKETLGVHEILIHEKRKDPHFSVQLSVVPGEILEFFSADGRVSAEPAIVRQVISTDKDDKIILESGAVLDFGFIGSNPPNDVLRPRAAPENVAAPENNSAEAAVEPEVELIEDVFPEIDFALLPAALVEEIPTEERTYSDSVQREDMFVAMLSDVPEKKQRDPKIMQELYRTTDLLLAMKNSVVVRDEGGGVLAGVPSTSYIADTLQDVVEKSRSTDTLRAFLPVIAVKKVLYTDDKDAVETEDTQSRSDVSTLIDAATTGTIFTEDAVGNAFVSYIHSVLQTIVSYVPSSASSTNALIPYDMDVLRSAIPPIPVVGFPSTGPAVNKKNEPVVLTSDSLGTINNRYVRLLTDSRLRDSKTGRAYTVAPADSGEVLSSIILSSDLLGYRRPARSSVLLWDIEASEVSRGRRVMLYPAMMHNWEAQTTYDPASLVSLKDILSEYVVATNNDNTSFNTYSLTTVLDSFGLRTMEISTTAFTPVAEVVSTGLAEWDRRYAGLVAATKAAAALPETFAVPRLISSDAVLVSETTFANPILQPVVQIIQSQETSLKTYDLALVSGLLRTAAPTLGRYYYGVCGGVAPDRIASLGQTYHAEVRRLNNDSEIVLKRHLDFQSAPEINPCSHVKQLEKVMNIRNDEARMLMLEKVLNTYQAGQRGNTILCGECGLDLICKHETLLLNEYLHPGRGQGLHKALLLDYAGPVFEGAYICKHCGQKIQELEYDTHLEFDDEGRPLVGRGVIAEEEDDDVAPEIVLREDVAESIPFTGADRAIYHVVRTLLENCGYAAPMDVYTRVVGATQDFLKLRVPDKDNYSRLREMAIQSAKRGAPVPPPYTTFFANYEVGVIGALAVLEIQTSSIGIPFPFSGCPLSRGGFPIDGADIAVAGKGALNYVACVIAHIFRNDAPWNLTAWSPETQIPKRVAAAENAVRIAIASLLCLPSGKSTPAPLTNVTDTYNELLKVARNKDTTEIQKPSETDVLPAAFRPIATPKNMGNLESVQNVKKYKANVATRPVAEVAPFVKARMARLNTDLMEQFNKESVDTGLVIEASPRSDSVCCFAKLGVVATTGLGVQSLNRPNLQAELELQTNVVRMLEARDSARVNNGTHIYVPWAAKVTATTLPQLDSSRYYQIFLQYCYRGKRHGALHEYNIAGTCRWCGFTYPAELLYLTPFTITEGGSTSAHRHALQEMAAKRKELATAALQNQGISFNESAFRVLEMAMKNQKAILVPEELKPEVLSRVLALMGRTLTMILPTATDEWAIFTKAMDEMSAFEVTDKERTYKLNEFSKAYDAELQSVLVKFTNVLGTKGCDRFIKRAGPFVDVDMSYRGAESTLRAGRDVFVKILDIFTTGPETILVRNLIDIFVTQAAQIRFGYTIQKPHASKWFPKISRHHKSLLDTIWTKSYRVVLDAINVLNDLSEETQHVVQRSLERYAGWFGNWLSILQQEIRTNVHLSVPEYRLVLQWSLVSGFMALLSENSPFYADATDSAKKVEAIRFHAGWVSDAMIVGLEHGNKYQKTAAEITEAINARAELEKAYFIKKFDDLDKDLRDIEKRKKALKIGDWAVGTLKNLFSYDANFFEFERGQRAAMGLPEFAEGVTGVAEMAMRVPVEEESGYDHRAVADEDQD